MNVEMGFIGVGDMGASMAARSLAAGCCVTVFDRNPAATQELGSLGATVTESLESLVAGVTQIHVVVVTDDQLRSVFLGDGSSGLVHHAAPGTILIVHSTVHPQTCIELAEISMAHNLSFLDAPVSGSTAKSKGGQGNLATFVGGEASVLERAMVGLRSFATDVFHVGPVGAGQTIKLANNLVAISNSVILSEGVRLARLAGI